MWREGNRWFGRLDAPDASTRTARAKSACLAVLRREAGRATLTVETIPELVGVAEAAALLGWDKRRVFTYISRGSFPEPIAMLASGRVWRKSDIDEYRRFRRARR